jgi:hypothetical protein
MPELEPVGGPGKANGVVADDFTLPKAFNGKRIA